MASVVNDQNQNVVPEKMEKTFCILQLTRIGDIIQTYQASLALKQERPDIKLVLVVRKNFGKGLDFLLRDVFDKIIYFDRDEVLGNGSQQTLPAAQERTRKLLAEINQSNITVLINLSFSKTSGYLSSLINADHKLGVAYDNNCDFRIKDKWSQFVYSNVQGGPLNPFSLVDIYKRILGLPLEWLEALPNKVVNNQIDRIMIHPFASSVKKRWKVEKWIEVIYKTLKENPEVQVAIVGGPEDRKASLEIIRAPLLRQFHRRVESLAGKISIEELFGEMKKCSLFVGHFGMGHRQKPFFAFF